VVKNLFSQAVNAFSLQPYKPVLKSGEADGRVAQAYPPPQLPNYFFRAPPAKSTTPDPL
jgi:hypothetical protein